MNYLTNTNSNGSSLLSRLVSGLLKNPGESLIAKITPSNRQVIKINTNSVKMSATRYPNGVVVETRTIRPK